MSRDDDSDREADGGRSVEERSVPGPGGEPMPPVVRSFVEAIPTPTLACDPESRAIRAPNERAVELLDQDSATLTLMGLTDIGETETTVEGDPVDEVIDAAIGTDGVTRFEWNIGGSRGRFRIALSCHTTVIADEQWLIVGLTDVTDRVTATEELQTQLGVIDAIASTAPAAMFQCTANGTLARWNDRLAADVGYEGPELSDRALTSLFDEESRDDVADALQRVYGEQTPVEFEATVVTRSGEYVPYQVALGPIADGDEVVGAVGIGRDVTAASLREERLAVLTRVLRHNFRNDLNVVTGFTQHAIEEIDNPELVSKLERVVDTAERLLRVGEMSRRIERLLAERPVPRRLDLASAVDDGVASLPQPLRERADIEIDVPEAITVSAVGYLTEAITELVDNAIRHNEAARPQITITAVELPSQSWASLVVADDGPGMPAYERSVLTGDETPLKHASGLGLWYVNWIVSAGGGTFDIAESKSGGTRIEIEFQTPDEA